MTTAVATVVNKPKHWAASFFEATGLSGIEAVHGHQHHNEIQSHVSRGELNEEAISLLGKLIREARKKTGEVYVFDFEDIKSKPFEGDPSLIISICSEGGKELLDKMYDHWGINFDLDEENQQVRVLAVHKPSAVFTRKAK